MERRMATDVLPKLGQRPIAEIETPEIVAVAKAVEARGAKELARMTLRNIGLVFRYAIANGYAKRNPASDIKPSDILQHAAVANCARIDQKDLPALLLAIENYPTFITRMLLRVMARTFVRTTELVEAPWDEFDLDGARWTIPPERMKKPSPHIVPLAWQVVRDLRSIRETTGNAKWVFPMGKDPTRPMSKSTILTALKLMGYQKVMTGHGFRGVASTILHEREYEDAHIESQLAHLKRNKVSAAYDYAKYLTPRAKMMQDWADILDQQLELARTPSTKCA
jgi:integrase